jgi:hypothetical protein
MRRLALPLGALAAAALLVAVLAGGAPDPPARAGTGGTLLLELFTSQGCSSCPPADRLLAELAADPRLADRVFPLAFHVDYWNHIGWTDPFSSAAWSARQRRYARALGDDRVYTPQLVVDGAGHLVGSRQAEVRRRVERELASPDAAGVTLAVEQVAGDRLRVVVSARRRGAPTGPPLVAWAALYEDALRTPVGRGENAGRHLANERVVRALARLFAMPAGSAEGRGGTVMEIGPAWRREELGVVAFLQDPADLRVHGAAGRRVTQR